MSAVAAAQSDLERASAPDVIAWAWESFGDGVIAAASFQDCVLVDLVSSVAPDIEVIFLDTHYHFPETLRFVEQVGKHYDLPVTVVEPVVPMDDMYATDPDACCEARKVEPFRRATSGKRAWITGLRRAESPSRASVPVVHFDARRGLVKINPLARWSEDDVAAYIQSRDLMEHPLTAVGYRSIGCWPCTRATVPGEDPRAGRWPGLAKSECGLHDDREGRSG